MIILGVETSCDETAVSIVRNGKEVFSNIVFSQIDIHKYNGGVIPEIASRNHVEKILYVFQDAIIKSSIKIKDIDYVAVTKTPGLIGSLIVGIVAAHTFAYVNDIKIIDIDHIDGHIYANYIEHELKYPLLALVVSGGHTELRITYDGYEFVKLGETLDDAVGECYDKVGRVLGLPYPGGIYVDKIAIKGNINRYKLPLVYLEKDSFNFSFSGLKSAVINLINKTKQNNEEVVVEDLAASFQYSAISVLTTKTIECAKKYKVKQIVLAGGVAANSELRKQIVEKGSKLEDCEIIYPSMKYCTDNAAMIAVAAFFKLKQIK